MTIGYSLSIPVVKLGRAVGASSGAAVQRFADSGTVSFRDDRRVGDLLHGRTFS